MYKKNNAESKNTIYKLAIKPILTGIYLLVYFVFKGLLYLPKLISEKIKSSISFKTSVVYFKIMVRVFTTILAGVVIYFIYVNVDSITHISNAKIEAIIQENNNLNNIIEQCKEQNFLLGIYDQNNNLIQKTYNFADYKYDNKVIPLRGVNGNYYYISSRSLNINSDKYNLNFYYNISSNVFQITQVLTIVTISYLLGILLTLIIGSAANREVLYPIFDMTQTVKSISANNLNLRINITGSKDELKELSKTFNDMMNRIEEAYNKQQQFVSDASHELRTPIAVIQGYANMLKRWGKNDPKVMQESIDAIANEAENIKDLVEKLLFIARSDKNTLKLQKEEFDLNELLVEVIKETEMINDKHTFLQAVTGKILIFADKNRVKQTLRIIIDNSMKYTPEPGEIRIKSETENNYAIISIIDNGIGISKEDLDNIFNRFYRSDKSRTKVNEGYGLGLYIAKIIVLRHKGKIKVRSKVDEGTEFQVYLPLGRLE